jgi:hypothetical protein
VNRYHPGRDWPEWYRPTIEGAGREYEIPADGDHNWGSVFVDDVKNVVFIVVIWS